MIFCVEIRLDIEADTPEQAIWKARITIGDEGEITAVFDEDYEEV